MKLYAIYAGLGGGFGGRKFIEFEFFECQEYADDYAECIAREEYESYEGIMHGILDTEECKEQGVLYEDEVISLIEYEAISIESEEQLIELGEKEGIDSDVICHFVTETFHK